MWPGCFFSFGHWVGSKKGLVQFRSHNFLDTSQSYVTIMHPVHLKLVIIGYINNKFSVGEIHSEVDKQ